MDQQLVRLFIGNWYDRLGAKLADARPPPDNKDNIRSWLRECHSKINQTRTSVFDPHHAEMPGQGTSAGCDQLEQSRLEQALFWIWVFRCTTHMNSTV